MILFVAVCVAIVIILLYCYFLFWIYRENLYFSEFAGTKDDLVPIVERLQPSLITFLKSKSHTFDANLHSLPPPFIFSVLSLSHIESELP